ncbi:MAG: amino acid racemase [Rhodospirillaceae bacterium]|nr:amino acid racemase [Rhodospirillaceae bacterium]MBT7249804.1 amino acid racemase [Rhodospirillaceae bacterium]
MIGGLSWVSTAEYYKRINEMTQEARGGVHSAELILQSVDRQHYVDAVIERQDEDAACEIILHAAKAVERGGAEFIVISCNDVHRFVPRVAPQISIPFLHIADATGCAVQAAGLTTVALLGVRKTMEEPFYPDVLKNHGITTIIPDEGEKTYIHDKIYDELVRDVFTEETRTGYLSIMCDLTDRGAEGVILGCTEIPLLIRPCDTDIATFSTTEIHCRAAVNMALDDA